MAPTVATIRQVALATIKEPELVEQNRALEKKHPEWNLAEDDGIKFCGFPGIAVVQGGEEVHQDYGPRGAADDIGSAASQPGIGFVMMNKLKLDNKRTILVGLAFLSICAFWQMYDNLVKD